jgi:tripartite-type tricarboxylate transporter receptor subunit TctC
VQRPTWNFMGALTLLAATLHAVPTCAQTPAEFYAGKQVSIIVGLSAGGGHDLYTRTMARYLGKYLNGANVIVQNMVGAGSLRAANHIANVAPKDGTVIGEVVSSIPFEPLFGNKQAQFKADELSWVGSINAEVSTCQVWNTAPVKTFEDAMKTQIAVGGTGTGADSNLFPTTLNKFAATKFKLVSGYPGTQQIFLAIESGELQGICGIYWSSVMAAHSDWVQSGQLKAIIQIALEKHPDHPDVPLILDYAKSSADRQAMELIFAPMKFARPYFGPPGIPADRLAYLREAFNKTMKDPGFLADMAKLKLEVGPMSGQEIEALIKRLYESPPEVVALAKEARQ